MQINSREFWKLWRYNLLQPLGGAVMITLLLFGAYALLSEVIIASFGATVFIVTTTPHAKAARTQNLIGGYLCGGVSGLLNVGLLSLLPGSPVAVFAGLAVGLAIFGTLALGCEHPPAGAMALGIVLTGKPLTAVGIAVAGILLLSAVLMFIRKHMRNLL
jgi:CBS domain-containing membrane protein